MYFLVSVCIYDIDLLPERKLHKNTCMYIFSKDVIKLMHV